MPKQKKQGLLLQVLEGRDLVVKGRFLADPEFEAAYPGLFELLNECQVDDKRRTKPGQIVLFNAGGDWAAKANYPTLGAHKAVLCRLWSECLPRLEAALWDTNHPWQFWLRKKLEVEEVKEKAKTNGQAPT